VLKTEIAKLRESIATGSDPTAGESSATSATTPASIETLKAELKRRGARATAASHAE